MRNSASTAADDVSRHRSAPRRDGIGLGGIGLGGIGLGGIARYGIAVIQLLSLTGQVVLGVFRTRTAGRHGVAGAGGGTGIAATLATAILISALVGGVMTLLLPAAPERLATATADPAGRLQAADRADRSYRLAPGAATMLSPTTSPNTPTPGPSAAAGPAAKPTPAWVNPLPGSTLTSCFGARWGTAHQGIDFAAAEGTPILSAADGTVLGAGWLYSGYGMSVMIDNGNGIYTHYAHAEQVLVTAGQKVVAGQPIALEGATGDATGPHLHFEVHEGLWNQIDPAPFLRAHGVAVGC